MRRTVRIIIFIALCATFNNSSAQSRGRKINKHDLKKLSEIMSGKLNSAAQSLADTNFLNISLVMEPIWTEKDDGHCFMLNKPWQAHRSGLTGREYITCLFLINSQSLARYMSCQNRKSMLAPGKTKANCITLQSPT